MAQARVIECIVRIDYRIFVANTNSQPATCIFFDFEGYSARSIAFLV